jgi:Kef-type K+ transport system membrane component KefB
MGAVTHNPLSLLIVQMVVIIGAARLIGRGTKWMGQPLVIAEVVAGILLGPSLLGWLAPKAMNTIFPASSMEGLKMLSQVGLILFMFLIGLELDLRMLKGRGRSSVVISHTSIVVPFALGAGAAFWLYPRLSESKVPFSSFVLFMGVAMSITAFPVLARILSERGLVRSRVGMITLTCAAVDDVTAWCLLAFIASIVRATNMGEAAYTTAFALLYIGLMLGVLRPFLKRLGARVAGREGLNQNVVALTLLLLLGSAWLTEQIGIHALFGAFLFGAIVPKEGGLAESLAEKLEDVAVVLLLPLFFAYSGLRTEIGLLSGTSDWAICGLIIFLACAGKFGGSALAARLTGLRWREAGALGILMNTRAHRPQPGPGPGCHLPQALHDAGDHGAGHDVHDHAAPTVDLPTRGTGAGSGATGSRGGARSMGCAVTRLSQGLPFRETALIALLHPEREPPRGAGLSQFGAAHGNLRESGVDRHLPCLLLIDTPQRSVRLRGFEGVGLFLDQVLADLCLGEKGSIGTREGQECPQRAAVLRQRALAAVIGQQIAILGQLHAGEVRELLLESRIPAREKPSVVVGKEEARFTVGGLRRQQPRQAIVDTTLAGVKAVADLVEASLTASPGLQIDHELHGHLHGPGGPHEVQLFQPGGQQSHETIQRSI